MPLSLPEYSEGGLGRVECSCAPASVFAAAVERARFQSHPGSWYGYGVVDDGSTYVRWDGVGEFLVAADGGRIACQREHAASDESFQVYMLGQALSFALVK